MDVLKIWTTFSWELIFHEKGWTQLRIFLQRNVINNWHFSINSSLQCKTEKGSIAGETKRNKQKPRPKVKPQHCLLHCTTSTDFKGARMLPTPPKSSAHCKKGWGVLYLIIHAPPKKPSFQNSFAPRSINVILYRCSPIIHSTMTHKNITYLLRKE